jgi:hypothetical protein
VGDALVAVHERMRLRKGEAQRTSLLNQSGMKVASAERCPGLGDRRFQRARVPYAQSTTAGRKHEAVQFNHLAQGQIAGSFELPGEVVCGSRQHVRDNRAGEILRRESEALSFTAKALGLGGR